MSRRFAKSSFAAILAVALCATLAMGGAADAKKKGKSKTSAFVQTNVANLPIPQYPGGTVRATPAYSTIVVGRKFKGRVVGDVNVTGLQTTGSGAGAADDLVESLTAPNGRTIDLFDLVGDQSIGPWTIDDDTATSICNSSTPPCVDATQTLNRPFAGTSNTIYNWASVFPTNGPLATFNKLPMMGPWTLTIADVAAGMSGGTNVLNQWGLQITPAKPVTK